MSLNIEVYDELIFPNLEVETKEDVIIFLAEKLREANLVADNYKDALLTRETIYPTGLPSNGYNVAIPHADYTLVNKTTVAIGILKKPVVFKAMDNVDQDIDVSLVIMLAINEPHGQIEMLQRIVEVIKNDELRRELVESQDKTHSIKELINYLKGDQ